MILQRPHPGALFGVAKKLLLSWLIALGISLSILIGKCRIVNAQEAWLFVPVQESAAGVRVPFDAMLGPWEKALPRVAHNTTAASVYEQRISTAAPDLSEEVRARAMSTIGRALQKLALGHAEEGTILLREIAQMPTSERERLLHSREFAQKMFDACIMRAYLYERQGDGPQSDQQLRSCAREYPSYPELEHGFEPVVHGPPKLQTAFGRIRGELAREQQGRLKVTSANKRCTAYLNGLSVGETPATVTRVPVGTARVQLQCEKKVGRTHQIVIGAGENMLSINPRFDSTLVTSEFLRLQYDEPSQRDSFMAGDALTLRDGLAIDHIVLLVISPRASSWSVEVVTLNPDKQTCRTVGTLEFSEAASYEPARLQHMVDALTGNINEKRTGTDDAPATVILTPNPVSPQGMRPAPSTEPASDSGTGFLVVGAATTVAGVAGLAVSWVFLADRDQFRRQFRSEITADIDADYKRRSIPILATSIFGAAAFAFSEYFWSPGAVEVPAYAWIVGGVGLASAAVGVGLALGDEHCGPERGSELRPPCRSIRGERLFGVEIALTALPLVTLPLAQLLRSSANAVSLSLTGNRSGAALTANLNWF